MYWNYKYNDVEMMRNGNVRREDLPDTICIMNNTRCAKVNIDDIEAVEQEGRKLHIITGSDDFICYEKIDKLAPLLLNRSFFRPMKSLILNLERVKEVTVHEVMFVSGQSMTMGKNNMLKLRRAYRNYILRYPPFTEIEHLDHVAEEKDLSDI